jgi:hypothetical protein
MPALKTAIIETSGRLESSRTRRRKPFGRRNFWISPAADGGFSLAAFLSEPSGLREETLRLSS